MSERRSNFLLQHSTVSFSSIFYYSKLIHAFSLSFASRMAVAILHLPDGLDFSNVNQDFKLAPSDSFANLEAAAHAHRHAGVCDNPGLQIPKTSEIFHIDSNLNLAGMVHSPSSDVLTDPKPEATMSNGSNTSPLGRNKSHDDSTTTQSNLSASNSEADIVYSTKGGSEVPKSVLNALTYFTRKQPKATIDIWWLYDDGGNFKKEFIKKMLTDCIT